MKALTVACEALRRRPLAAAVAASLALHGGALAGAHFLLQGDGPGLPAVRHVGFVVIERPQAASRPAPAPQPEPERRAARADQTVPAGPVIPVPARATPPREASEPPARLTPRRRPDAPTQAPAEPFPAAAPATDPGTAPATDAPPAQAARGADPAPRQQAALDGGETSPPAWGAPGQANPAPAYPWLSRQKGEQGRVVLRVAVDAEGRAADVGIAASSGFGRLDRAAQAAIRRWRFAPARRAGIAVPGHVEVPVTFRLSDG